MLEKLKGNILFHQLLKRPDIRKAYKMVPPTDSWYDTISCVHNSLAEIQRFPHETWKMTSHDGLEMQGVYYPCGSQKTMIWLHGYTSHAQRESAFPALFYRSLGFNVLIPYQRAHGISQGKYISFGALESRDLLGWIDQVNKSAPDGSIVLHGLSMGGAIVLFALDQEMPNVKCVIADAPNTKIEDVFFHVARDLFKQDGDQVAEYALSRFRNEFGVRAEQYNAFEIIKKSRYPLFLTAGSCENMEEVLNALKDSNPQETKVLILPGCNHGNGMYKQTELYQGALKAFMDKHLPEQHLESASGCQDAVYIGET